VPCPPAPRHLRRRDSGRTGATSSGRGCEDAPAIAATPSTKLLLSTGAILEVAGTLEDTEKLLQNAVRSSPGTFARLQDAASGDAVVVNPAQVVTVTRER
jgi:hypothetical protein